ncbi:MAG: GSCFA domain-containing protein [Bacteroidaceae bacterium]|nr:GSCFA domain-containing protein [Bacteroidaceae bacterium]
MKLSTDVGISPLDRRIKYRDKILLTGSCFTDSIGSRLTSHYYSALVNPFGVLFNPESICSLLDRAIGNGDSPELFSKDDLFYADGMYNSWYIHGKFANPSAETVIANANSALMECNGYINSSKWIIITLGTSWIYRLKENGLVVSNCHKMGADLFTREQMTVEMVENRLAQVFQKMNKDTNIILTVSPVRHLKDGLHQNSISKSVLLLATERLCNRFENVHYFPAYEIMMDQLRDYRFYDTDMCHPSTIAVDIIFERFREYALSNEKRETDMFERAEKIHLAMEHRILNSDSQSALAFEKKRMSEYSNFMQDLSTLKSE